MRRWSSLFIAGVAALAACSGEQANPVGPAVPNGPALSLASSADGQYIVMLRGNASNFEKRVAELGGSVVHSHKGAGIAVVAGLSANSANQLANANGVADVFPDAVMSLPRTAPEAVVPMDEVTIQSQANPATSIRYSWQWNMRAIGASTPGPLESWVRPA